MVLPSCPTTELFPIRLAVCSPKVKTDYGWRGNFALTLTRIPHMGRLSDMVHFSLGDSGHAVTTTHLLGKILGEGGRSCPRRQDFPVLFTMPGACWYGLRDRLRL